VTVSDPDAAARRIVSLMAGEAELDAGKLASEDCNPSADGRGPVDYKRHLAGELTKRALRRAAERALNQEA